MNKFEAVVQATFLYSVLNVSLIDQVHYFMSYIIVRSPMYFHCDVVITKVLTRYYTSQDIFNIFIYSPNLDFRYIRM